MFKNLSVNKRVFIQYTLSGLLWMVTGLINIVFMITKIHFFFTLFDIFVILDMAVNISVLFYKKRENDDELSEKDLNLACRRAVSNMTLIFLLFVIFILLIFIFKKSSLLNKVPLYEGIMMSISVLLSFLGITQFMIGILYKKEENSGSCRY